jgi:predicted RecB family nuclease
LRLLDGETIYSATDLVGFAACEHLTQLELAAARGEITRPQREDPLLDILVRRGEEHEADLLAAYPGEPLAMIRIERGSGDRASLRAAAAATIEAMKAGAPMIYQAAFLHDGWVGYADFVERVEQPSTLGDWSYEVADAKLARSVRASALVQLCEYSEHLARIQGVAPQRIHVITGDGVRHPFRLADYAAYHRSLKARFLATASAGPTPTYPDPVEHCGICRWWAECKDRRRADDHLSLVAGMRRSQASHLVDAGISSRHALAAGPDALPGAGIGGEAYQRLHLQASLQVRGEGHVPPLYELLPPDAAENDRGPRGFAALPAPSPGDLFLDLEGDPYALDGGLEYLFGLVEVVDGERKYHEFWAHNRHDERVAFEGAVDLIETRRREHPRMHVYHYAPYEQTAFRRLMGAHGTREDEIDNFLRGGIFVDLFRVVRQAVRVSTESYSLKQIEKLYFTRPPGEVMDAGSSIITYERFLADHDTKLLEEIALYNRDDCESLVGLQEWLEARRVEAERQFGPIPRTAAPELAEEGEVDDLDVLAARLLVNVPDEPAERSDEEHGRYLLAHLLKWHGREAKPAWWRYFERLGYEPQETVADSECIGGLELVEEIGPVKKSTLYRMRFEPQEHKFSAGSEVIDPATGGGATIVTIDERGTLELKRGNKQAGDPLPRALIPGGPLNNEAQRVAIGEIGAWVADHGLDTAGPYQAMRDLLLRRPPRYSGAVPKAPLRTADEHALDTARRIALALDGGCLAIQGPPGAGKTYTGARMIVALLKEGKRVGITATTHSAIGNLMSAVVDAAAEVGVVVNGMQRTEADQSAAPPGVEYGKKSKKVEAALLDGKVQLVAGTPWLWARPGLRESVDVLFIDEAGQMSLADAAPVGTAARNLVLLGDPQQLAQVSQGSHPDGAEASALEHLLGDHDTIPADRGIFLDLTWRMHPSVCAYVSEIAYEDRLESAPGLERQLVDGSAGLWFVPVHHEGDTTRSEAEAEAVAELIDQLLGTAWTDHEGRTRPLALDDIIVIAPYNRHVAMIKAQTPDGTRVGTVDKFQGREGAVAIYSMASSSAEDAPRGMNFLYDLNRLNVAVSRARSRAYIVASPELLRVLCHTPEQLYLANALCRYAQVAAEA